MQIAMLPALVMLVGFLREGRKPGAHHMPRGSRVVTCMVFPALAFACVWGQWIMAEGILVAGGAIPE